MPNFTNTITISHTWIATASSALRQHSQVQNFYIYICLSPRAGDQVVTEVTSSLVEMRAANLCGGVAYFGLESCTLRMVLEWFEALAFAGDAKHVSRPVGFSRFVFDPWCVRAKILWK